ncbi:CorA family divalent cation transporter [Mangrovicoccus algicola]|uniref:Magnesium transporter n=1 Tax=Mangrovicoccus algicola TaxID=2771008 RepID=A0A8J6YUG3_9RHOB|nr:CorA family divalent cation transporter [Mangrovicoccus algicola]MBE3639483.1 magnesium transporter [Mangrovicoccus algicola]
MTISAYRLEETGLRSMDPREDLSGALWIDFYNPGKADAERMRALGFEIPRLQDMSQIEPSQRLTRRGGADMLTVMLTEPSGDGDDSFAPVTLMLREGCVVTVRFRGPNLWNGFSLAGRRTPGDVAVALLALGVGHIADVLENWDRELDRTAQLVFKDEAMEDAEDLRGLIRATGRMGEALSDIRLNLLILRRTLVHLDQLRAEGRVAFSRKAGLKTADRDVEALTVHADALAGRVSLAIDATMGLISLSQNDNARYYSLVATIFLPATLIASIFGMNFDEMPMLHWIAGFEVSLGLMAASSAAILLFFVLRRWL